MLDLYDFCSAILPPLVSKYQIPSRGFIILDLTMPTRGLRVFAYNTAFQIVSQNKDQFVYATRTPARTLVMSRTRMPANGSVGESTAAVARPLQSEQFEPLVRTRGLRYLARPKAVFDTAIAHQKQDADAKEEKKDLKTYSVSCRSNNQPPEDLGFWRGNASAGSSPFLQTLKYFSDAFLFSYPQKLCFPISIMFTGIVEVTGSTSLLQFPNRRHSQLN